MMYAYETLLVINLKSISLTTKWIYTNLLQISL